MSYEEEKRELLKLKQGIIEQSDIIKEEKPEQIKLTGRAWWKNFLYHHKIRLIVAFLALALFSFLMYNLLSKTPKDIRVIIAGSDNPTSSILYLKSEDIELAFERFCPDFDSNDIVHVETYYVDLSTDRNQEMYFANQAKLYGELSTGVAQIFMGNKELFDMMIGEEEPESMFLNLSELYPDNPNVDGLFFKVKGSKLAYDAHWEASCPDNLYIAVRGDFEGLVSDAETMTAENKKALEVLDNIINDNEVNEEKTEK